MSGKRLEKLIERHGKDDIEFTILSTGIQLLCVVHVQWVAVSVVHYTEGWDGLGQVSHKSITNMYVLVLKNTLPVIQSTCLYIQMYDHPTSQNNILPLHFCQQQTPSATIMLPLVR